MQSLRGVKLVILFGSRVKGCATSDSDADIAVLANHELSLHEKGDIAAHMGNELQISEDKIDVVDLRNVSPLLEQEIATHGKLLHGSEVDFLRFRVLAWKKYQDTAKFRRAREKNLAKTLHGRGRL